MASRKNAETTKPHAGGPEEQESSLTSPDRRKKWDIIHNPLTLLVGVAGIFIAGFSLYVALSNNIWEGRLNTLKERVDLLQAHNAEQSKEFEKAKQDLAEARKKDVREVPKEFEATRKTPFVVTVMKDQPLKVPPNLGLRLIGLRFISDPTSRYLVSAVIEYEGEPEMQIKDAEIGYSVTYPVPEGYKITLLASDSVSATFSILKRRVEKTN